MEAGQRLEALRTQPWEAFAGAVESAFRRDGYAVTRLDSREADFELTKAGRVSLVSCKRWKAAPQPIPIPAATRSASSGCARVRWW